MSLAASIVWFVVALIVFAITVIIPLVRYINKKRAKSDEKI